MPLSNQSLILNLSLSEVSKLAPRQYTFITMYINTRIV